MGLFDGILLDDLGQGIKNALTDLTYRLQTGIIEEQEIDNFELSSGSVFKTVVPKILNPYSDIIGQLQFIFSDKY